MAKDYRECFAKAASEVAARGGRPISVDELNRIEEAMTAKIHDGANGKKVSLTQAVTEAKNMMKKRVKEDANLTKTRAALDLAKLSQLKEYVDSRDGLDKDAGQALLRKLFINDDGKSAAHSVESISHGYMQSSGAVAALDKAQKALRTGFGFRLDNSKLVDWIMGRDNQDWKDPEVKEAVMSIKKTYDYFREKINAMGGNIGDVEEFYTRQNDATWRVAAAGEAKWIDERLRQGWLDRRRMLDENGNRLDDEQLEKLLKEAYSTKVTNGGNAIKSRAGNDGNPSNKFSQSRVLHYTSEGWLKNYAGYADEDFGMMLDKNMRSLANQAALMQEFGPNARANAETVLNVKKAEYKKAGDNDLINSLEESRKAIDSAFDYFLGKEKGITNPSVDSFSKILRNLQKNLIAGALPLKFFVDQSTSGVTAAYGKSLRFDLYLNQLKRITEGDDYQRRLQASGLMAHTVAQNIDGISRSFSKENFPTGVAGALKRGELGTAQLASAMMRASIIPKFTKMIREVWSVNFMKTITDALASDKGLHPDDIRTFKEYGVSNNDIAIWKMAKFEDWGSYGKMITPDSIRSIPDADILALKSPELQKAKAIVEARRQELESFNDDRAARAQKRVQDIRGKESSLADRLNRFITRTQESAGTALDKTIRSLYDDSIRKVNERFGKATDQLTKLQQKVQDYEDAVKQAFAEKDNAAFERAASKARKIYSDIDKLSQVVQGPDTVTSEQHDEALRKAPGAIKRANVSEDKAVRQAISEQTGAKIQMEQNLQGNQVSGDAVQNIIDSYQKAEDAEAKNLNRKIFEAEQKSGSKADKAISERYEDMRKQVADHWNDYLDWWDQQKKYIAETNRKIEELRQLHEDRVNQYPKKVREDAVVRLYSMVHSEAIRKAAVDAGARVKSQFHKQNESVLGGAISQFKETPWAIMSQHYTRYWNLDGPARIKYTASFAALGALAAATATTFNALRNGNNAPGYFDTHHLGKAAELWASALARGAMGPVGDILIGDMVRSTNSLADVVGGPLYQEANDLWRAGAATKEALFKGDLSSKSIGKVVKPLVDAATPLIPFTNLWYTSGLFKHIFLQNMHETMNPGYLQRVKNQSIKDTGQAPWWTPGQPLPSEWPTVSTIGPHE